MIVRACYSTGNSLLMSVKIMLDPSESLRDPKSVNDGLTVPGRGDNQCMSSLITMLQSTRGERSLVDRMAQHFPRNYPCGCRTTLEVCATPK